MRQAAQGTSYAEGLALSEASFSLFEIRNIHSIQYTDIIQGLLLFGDYSAPLFLSNHDPLWRREPYIYYSTQRTALLGLKSSW
jgi:hypothetical protein